MKFTNLLSRTQLLVAELRAAVSDASQTKTATSTNLNIVTLEERIMLSASPMALESVDAGSAAPLDIGDDGQSQPTQTTNDPQLNSEFGIENATNTSRQRIVIDSAVEIFDEDLEATDDFGGTTLTIHNSGSQGTGDPLTATGSITVDLEWTFNDGTITDQGSGEARETTGVLTARFEVLDEAPVANNDTYTLDEDSSVMGNVFDNDTDDNPGFTVFAVSEPANGSIELNNRDGSFTFVPYTDFQGVTFFTYQIVDSAGALSNVATVTLNVTAVNDDPFNDGTLPSDITVTEDVLSSVDFSSINLMDADDVGQPLTIRLTTATGGVLNAVEQPGVVTVNVISPGQIELTGRQNVLNDYLNNPGNVTYLHSTANLSGNDVDAIQVEVSDNGNSGAGGGGFIDFGVANVDIAAVNDAPVNQVPPLQNVLQNGTVVFDTANGNTISISDVDAENEVVRVSLSAVNGTLVIPQPNNVTFIDAADGGLDTSFSVEGTVSEINDALNGLSFTPDTNFTGTAAVGIATNDLGNNGSGGAQTTIDSFSIAVAPTDLAPETTDATGSGNEDTPIPVILSGRDSDGNVTAFQITQLPTDGTLFLDAARTQPASAGTDIAVTGNGVLQLFFEPSVDFNGPAEFMFSAVDDDGNLDATPATARINVSPVNDAPVNQVPSTQSIAQNGTLDFDTASGNLIAISDVDVSNDDVQVTLSVTNGTILLAQPNSLTFLTGTDGVPGDTVVVEGRIGEINVALDGLRFTPDSNFSGDAVIEIATNDLGNNGSGDDLTTTDSVIIVVADGVAPEAIDVLATGTEDNPVAIELTGTDIDGTVASFILNSLPANGTLYTDAALTSVAVTGIDYTATGETLTLYFSPDADWNGTTTFRYSATDNSGLADATPATATIEVAPVSDAPTGMDNMITIAEDVPYTLSLDDFGFDDVDGDSFVRIVITDLPEDGQLISNGQPVTEINSLAGLTQLNTGGLVFQPGPNATGTDSFSFVVVDNGSNNTAETPQTITFNITPVNDTPVALDDNYSADEGGTIVIDAADGLLLNDSDADGDTLTVTLGEDALHGDLVLNSDGSFTYTHDGSETTSDFFTYTVDDGNGGTTTARVDLIITPVNDAPVSSDITLQSFEDTSLSLTPSIFEFNDVDGNAFQSVIITTLPSNGTLTFGLTDVSEGDVIPFSGISSLTYSPNANLSGLAADSFTFQVVDDGGTANGGENTDTPRTALINLTPSNDAPELDLDADDSAGTPGINFTTAFEAGDGPVALTDGVSLDDVDGTVQEVRIFISNIEDGTNEVLAFNSPNIASVYSPLTGVLRLVGSSNTTNADFESVLNSLTYENTSNNPTSGTREITFIANDGITDSVVATAFVTITSDIDAPVVANNTGITVDEGGQGSISTIELKYTDAQLKASVEFNITSAPNSGFIALQDDPTTPIDSFTQADVDLIGLVFVHDGSEVTSDSFTFDVSDGVGNSTLEQRFEIIVNPVNDAPVVDLTNIVSTLAENTSTTSSLRIAEIVISDDATGFNEITLSGTDADQFTVVGNELHLRAGTTLDFEANAGLDVEVNVNDSTLDASAESTASHSLEITDVNESPTVSLSNVISTLPIGANIGSSIRVADIVIVDDALGSENLSIAGPNADSFEIIGSELRLRQGTLLSSLDTIQQIIVQADDPTLGIGVDTTAAFSIGASGVEVAPPPSFQPTTEPEPDTDTDTEAENTSESTDNDAAVEPISQVLESNLLPESPERNSDNDTAAENRQIDASSDFNSELTEFVLQTASTDNTKFTIHRFGNLEQTVAGEGLEITSFNNFTVAQNSLSLSQVDAWIGAEANNSNFTQIAIGSSAIATTSLSVGYVIWLLRGGSLFASLLTSMPAWTSFDPLPVVTGFDKKEDTESLSDIAKKKTDKKQY